MFLIARGGGFAQGSMLINDHTKELVIQKIAKIMKEQYVFEELAKLLKNQ